MRIRFFAASLLLFANLPLVHAQQPIATFFPGDGEVIFEPKPGNYDRIVLSVSLPNGDVYSEDFPRGNIPGIVFDGDGQYSYELYKVPVGVAKNPRPNPNRTQGPTDANGRAQGSGQPAFIRRGPVQAGYFTVVGGDLVDPDLEEGVQ